MAVYGGTKLNFTNCHHSMDREIYRYIFDEDVPKCPFCGTPIAQKDINFYNNSKTVDGSRYSTGNYNNPLPQMNQAEHERKMAEYFRQLEIDRQEVEEEERLQREERKRKQVQVEAPTSKYVSQPTPQKRWLGGWFGFGSKNKVHQDIKYLKSIK